MVIFKAIQQYLKYSVSSTGLVINNKTGKYLKLTVNADGYLRVNLYTDKSRYKTCRVHRLVALAFIANPENKPTVNHRNGVRNDNRTENLAWATCSEQQEHSYEILGRKDNTENRKGGLNKNAKKVKAVYPDGREKIFACLKDFTKDAKVIYTNASRVLRGKQNSINKIKLTYFG